MRPGIVHPGVATVDYHTAGEPFRIVIDGVPPVPGTSVRDRREHAQSSPEIDHFRQLLCNEPRGHADMYGCFVVPPDDDGADLGALFWHKDGYSTACGHGTIALGVWAVEFGRVAAVADGVTEVTIDVPSGRVVAAVRCVDGLVESVAFRNVPAYVIARGVPAAGVSVDVSYGGAIYASVPASAFGLSVAPEHYSALIAAGRAVKADLAGSDVSRHPSDDRLSGIYGTILYDDLGDGPHGAHQRNVTVFADGEVDRSPCGSGTSARAALLAADGRLDGDRVLRHDSIVGTTFLARVTERVVAEGRDAVVTEVVGSAYRTGDHRFVLDPRDPVGTGFVLR
ncbi:MAG: proline racemase [Thermoleophilales bacterium]|nr:proline racemase [Thermoleophilales bacterium]